MGRSSDEYLGNSMTIVLNKEFPTTGKFSIFSQLMSGLRLGICLI
jgi:hypothetical protein